MCWLTYSSKLLEHELYFKTLQRMMIFFPFPGFDKNAAYLEELRQDEYRKLCRKAKRRSLLSSPEKADTSEIQTKHGDVAANQDNEVDGKSNVEDQHEFKVKQEEIKYELPSRTLQCSRPVVGRSKMLVKLDRVQSLTKWKNVEKKVEDKKDKRGRRSLRKLPEKNLKIKRKYVRRKMFQQHLNAQKKPKLKSGRRKKVSILCYDILRKCAYCRTLIDLYTHVKK